MHVAPQTPHRNMPSALNVIRKAKQQARTLTLTYAVTDFATSGGAASSHDVVELHEVMTELEEILQKVHEYGPLEYHDPRYQRHVRASLVMSEKPEPVDNAEAVEWYESITGLQPPPPLFTNEATRVMRTNSMSPGTFLKSLHTCEAVEPLQPPSSEVWRTLFGGLPPRGEIFLVPQEDVMHTPCRFKTKRGRPCLHDVALVLFDGLDEVHACIEHRHLLYAVCDRHKPKDGRFMILCEVDQCCSLARRKSKETGRPGTHLCPKHALQWKGPCDTIENYYDRT